MASPYEIEVTITSAKDLKNVNWRSGKLKPYAVVWIDPDKKCSTRVDEQGDTSPYWDEKLTVPFNSPIHESTLHIDIVHVGTAEGTKPLIGSAKLRLNDVVDDVGLGNCAELVLDLKRPSGRPQGKLDVKVIVREHRYRAPEPYYPHPYGVPPPGIRDYAPPPPPVPYGNRYGGSPPYGAPSAPSAGYPGYGAPGSYGQAGYGQGSYVGQQQGFVVEEEKKKSKFGGMGTGLAVGAVAGALGGLALAEGFDALEDKIEDDVAERVEDDEYYDGDDF
ncbi:hypothetical protein ACJIZ3_022278 [Penstemon smallii]|uniref:C2 domain-containing protein n=1 Tax=Penstemon smallii TaxID=265156 RepID=A0ABD3TLQ0_9LAMI